MITRNEVNKGSWFTHYSGIELQELHEKVDLILENQWVKSNSILREPNFILTHLVYLKYPRINSDKKFNTVYSAVDFLIKEDLKKGKLSKIAVDNWTPTDKLRYVMDEIYMDFQSSDSRQGKMLTLDRMGLTFDFFFTAFDFGQDWSGVPSDMVKYLNFKIPDNIRFYE